MLFFFTTFAIGLLPPLDMYWVLMIPALRVLKGGLPSPAESLAEMAVPAHRRLNLPLSVGSGIHSAIHGKIRPGNVRGLRTGDNRHQRGDLFNLPVAVERCGGLLGRSPIARARGSNRARAP